MSFDDFEREGRRGTGRARHSSSTSAVTSRSTSSRSPSYCRAEGIVLIEDCAHAHGASWNGRRPGTWGDAGDLVVRADEDDLDRRGRDARLAHDDLIEFARSFRNYGKPDYDDARA